MAMISSRARVALLRSARLMSTEASEAATQVNLNLLCPHKSILENTKVELVVIPGVSGEYGVTAGHTPVLAEMKPGIIEVHHTMNEKVDKYFVSGGFAFSHENSTTDITAADLYSLEDLDVDAVRDGLASATTKLASLTPETEDHAMAQISFETYNAMAKALGLTQ
jgi:F-type H+-transporting ATPase subunit delta